MNASALSAVEMVNVARYPLDDPTSAGALAERCQREYRDTGLCMLPDFILPRALRMLADEADRLSGDAYFCDNTHNAYLTAADPDLPTHHPVY